MPNYISYLEVSEIHWLRAKCSKIRVCPCFTARGRPWSTAFTPSHYLEGISGTIVTSSQPFLFNVFPIESTRKCSRKSTLQAL